MIRYFQLCVLLFLSVQAQNQVVAIWPGPAPGSEKVQDLEQWTESKDVTNVFQPDLTVFLPEGQAGKIPAVIVCPGGGYRKLVMEKEGYKIARWFNEHGIAAYVLKYRLDPENALQDARRAVRYLRKEADHYGIDPQKIGAIGFSAGAHLACNLALNHRQSDYNDDIDSLSPRPDFWIGIYGGYNSILRTSRSSISTEHTPPAFLVHAGDDSKVPVMASVKLYEQLKKKGVPAELHIYEQGEHGFALEEDRGDAVTSTVKDWSKRLLEWLKVKEVI